MRRPISIAMVNSVVLHAALFFWLAAWSLKDVSEPRTDDITLNVRIEFQQPDDVRNTDQEADKQPVIDELVSEDITSRPADTSVQATKITESIDAVAETEESSVAEFTVVTTVSDSDQLVTIGDPDVEKRSSPSLPLSAVQQKMLARKLRRVAEDFDKLPEVEGGLAWKHRGQEYIAKFRRLPAKDDMDIDHLILEVSTEENGKTLSTEVRMKRLAFSNYAQFVHRWDPEVEIHRDELDGRFHANSEISLGYDRKFRPKFYGRVTTAARKINVTDGPGQFRRNEIFLGGLETGVKAIRLPKHFSPIPGDTDVGDDRAQHFDVDTRITFYADGTYGWRAIGSSTAAQRTAITDNTHYLIAAKRATLHIRGTINGRVLVYSPERIIIEGDIVYAQNPQAKPDADDFLGLVSDKYVDVAEQDITGPGDLRIQASIYAKRRFSVRGYRARPGALLHIYGSLVAGSLSATEPRYYTKIQFDKRLEKQRPPGFPMTNRFEVEFWKKSWTVQAEGT